MVDINAFSQCVFVQFSLNKDNTPTIPDNGIKEFAVFENKKYDNVSFIGVTRASKYGIRKLKGCTHWGIVDVSNPDKPTMVHYDTYPSSKPQVIKMRNHYVIVRGKGNHHMNLVISEYQSHQKMKQAHEGN